MLRAGYGCFGAVWLLMASLVSAEVSVKFSNYTLLPTTTNEVYAITLLFIVDGTGNVVLDASTAGAHQILRDAVNAWDGPVGTISYAGAFNTTFLLEIRSWGGVGLNLSCHEGGGLGVGLRSAWRIDRPGFEYIAATAAMGAGVLEFRSVSWNYRSKLDAHMVLACPLGSVTNSLPSRAGTWTLSDQGIRIGDNQTLRFENVFPGEDASGYALAGFSFDVVDAGGGFSGTADLIRNSGVPEGFPVATPKGRE